MAPQKFSPFMSFVKEFRNKDPEGCGMNMKQAVEHCGTIWENMEAAEREPYMSGAMSIGMNNKARKKNGRHNCHGTLISDMEALELEVTKAKVSMRENIEQMVFENKSRDELENAKFIFGSFNYFLNVPISKICVPAEFSACKFSLKEGVQSTFGMKINPSELVFGQAYNAEHHSSNTHKLPLPPLALGESNMKKLYENIHDYLQKCLNGKSLVVFTTSKEMVEVKGCFNYIKNRYQEYVANDDTKLKTLPPILVYDIEYLFYILKKRVMSISREGVYNINMLVTNEYFNSDVFEHINGIACKFHENIDRSKYCTLRKVIGWAYTFCDYMCKDLKITMEQGKHAPLED